MLGSKDIVRKDIDGSSLPGSSQGNLSAGNGVEIQAGVYICAGQTGKNEVGGLGLVFFGFFCKVLLIFPLC